MYQLQVLFASLQKSQQAAYDPEPLVQALKIKKTEQQDAQEFSKLFLNLLDREVKKQAKKAEAEGGDASVGKLVEDLVRQRNGRSLLGLGLTYISSWTSLRARSPMARDVPLVGQNRSVPPPSSSSKSTSK